VNKDEAIARGQAAGDLLDSETFKRVFVAFEAYCAEAWKQTAPANTEDRERMYLMIQMQAEYLRILNIWRGEAQVESHTLRRRTEATQALN
jgi:hypothetical protein